MIAPVKVAVLPLQKNKPELVETAKNLYKQLQRSMVAQYDDIANIGRRYRRQDEIGTPFCVTIDFQTLDDQTVTIRERDSTEQVRVPIDSLVDELSDRLAL